jgi:hypothetical protein
MVGGVGIGGKLRGTGANAIHPSNPSPAATHPIDTPSVTENRF